MTDQIIFPEDFVWGAATAAYQIEGAVDVDGRGTSIWDTFSHTPGKVQNGDTGDVACAHYHRWQEDVALMAQLGLDAYRFSIAWPRILPEGTGEINGAGLDFYDKLVDGLLEEDIEPWVTLYHWDLPQALQDRFGGWAGREIVEAFADYAGVVSERLSDRVGHWMTINEPWVVATKGYLEGKHAPGLTDQTASLKAAHHLLMAHARAEEVLRAAGGEETQVGIVLNLTWAEPASQSHEDQAAARRVEGNFNRWYLDPLYKGHYPADMLLWYGDAMPDFPHDDLDTLTPPDFLGVNYYTRHVIREGESAEEWFGLQAESVAPEGEYTEMGWEVHPESLYNLLVYLEHGYAPSAIYITENGAAFDDTVEDGAVHDPRRRAYIQAHLAQAHRAIENGVPLRGYFVWSLLDNFEWALGYGKRFGIVHVDYETLARTLKDSGKWYAEAIAQNGFMPAEA